MPVASFCKNQTGEGSDVNTAGDGHGELRCLAFLRKVNVALAFETL